MKRTERRLDADAALALEVAEETAGAFGDAEVTTAHLLFGIAASAKNDILQLLDLYALDPLRVERALNIVRYAYLRNDGADIGGERDASRAHTYDGDPVLTASANAALARARKDGGATGVFEILVGTVESSENEAAEVLRLLGVDVAEFAKMAEFGALHLDSAERRSLIATIDRRSEQHVEPWWGPAADATLVDFLGEPMEVAKGESAICFVDQIAAGPDGFRLDVRIDARQPWLLPPAHLPAERLVPGVGSNLDVGPDLCVVSVSSDEGVASNAFAIDRYARTRPVSSALMLLSHRIDSTFSTDRREGQSQTVHASWWHWPLPATGVFEVAVDWPAESLVGSTVLTLNPALATDL